MALCQFLQQTRQTQETGRNHPHTISSTVNVLDYLFPGRACEGRGEGVHAGEGRGQARIRVLHHRTSGSTKRRPGRKQARHVAQTGCKNTDDLQNEIMAVNKGLMRESRPLGRGENSASDTSPLTPPPSVRRTPSCTQTHPVTSRIFHVKRFRDVGEKPSNNSLSELPKCACIPTHCT